MPPVARTAPALAICKGVTLTGPCPNPTRASIDGVATVRELANLSSSQAGRVLRGLCRKGKLQRAGTPPRWTYYVAANK